MLKSGHRVRPVLGEEGRKQYEDFDGNRFGTVRVYPGGWLFTSPLIEFADRIYDFQVTFF